MIKPLLAALVLTVGSAAAHDGFLPVIYAAGCLPCPCERAEILRQVAAFPDIYPGEQLVLVGALAGDDQLTSAATTRVLLTLLSNPATYYGTRQKIMCALPSMCLEHVHALQVKAAVRL